MTFYSGQTSSQRREEGSAKIEEHIKSALEYFAYDDAKYLAEAYYCKEKTDNALYLLSQCLFRSGSIESAYHLLKQNGFRSAQCRLLFARSALELGKLQDAESALRDDKVPSDISLHPSFTNSPLLSSHASSLLARIMSETNRISDAQLLHKRALTQNSLSWTSIRSFYDMRGESLRDVFAEFVGDVATETDDDEHPTGYQSAKEELHARTRTTRKNSTAYCTPEMDAESNARRKPEVFAAPRKKAQSVSYLRNKSVLGECATEPRRSTRMHSVQGDENASRLRSHRQLQYNSKGLLYKRNYDDERRSSSRTSSTPAIHADAAKSIYECSLEDMRLLESAHAPRSHPLSPMNTPQLYLGRNDNETVFEAGSRNSGTSIRIKTIKDEVTDDVENDEPFAAVVKPKTRDTLHVTGQDPVFCDIVFWTCKLSEVQRHFSCYQCEEALKLIHALPKECSKLPLSMELHGRVLFEDTQHLRAIVVFEELHRLYPSHAEGMEMFSSALWQTQDAKRLSALAADLTSMAGDRPESWCVAANSFSLQKPHKGAAVESLQRAIRLNPRFGYAYSLMGQELLEQNEPRQAAESFRKGILYSPNDYRLWYGLGSVDLREEKRVLACVNISKALRINPRNTVLLCQLAIVEHSLGNNAV
ncbi:MAT-1 protein, partial [Aphelenchoides avenae]